MSLLGFEFSVADFAALADLESLEIQSGIGAPAIQALIQSGVTKWRYLVELYPNQIGIVQTSGAEFTIADNLSLADEGSNETVLGLTALRYSDAGHTTWPTDPAAVANIHYEGRVISAGSMSRSLPLAPEDQRRTAFALGTITLNNADGGLDTLPHGFSIQGRAVTVRLGSAGWAYNQFAVLFEGYGVDWETDDTTLPVTVAGADTLLAVPYQTMLYGGTGGFDGGSDLAGKPKPTAYGYCWNVTPALLGIIGGLYCYQVHYRGIQDVPAVYDGGVPLTKVPYPPGIGQYSVDTTNGLFYLGYTPLYAITCDVQGDNVGGWVSTCADIAERIFTGLLGWGSSRLALWTFTGLANAESAPIGLWIGTDASQTAEAVLDILLGAIAGWWGVDRYGLMEVGLLQAPTGDPVATLTQYEIMSIARAALPASISPPNYIRRVAWQHNETIQASGLAGGISATRLSFVQIADREAVAIDPTISENFANAQDPGLLPSRYANESDAVAKATTLLGMYGVQRDCFQIVVNSLGAIIDRDDEIEIIYPRHGLQNGKSFRVIAVDEDYAADQTTLTVWG